MNKRLLGVVLVMFLGLGVGVFIAALGTDGGVTKANFDRIGEAATFDEVTAIFGGPPNDFSPSGRNWSDYHSGMRRFGSTREVWGGEHGAAVLIFDEQHRVETKNWVDSPESFRERLRRRFPWLRL